MRKIKFATFSLLLCLILAFFLTASTCGGGPWIKKLDDLAKSLTISGKTAYVADMNKGLCILNFSDFNNITSSTYSKDMKMAVNVFLYDDTVFVSDPENGIHIIDVSDKNSPILKILFDDEGNLKFPTDLIVLENSPGKLYMVVSDMMQGIVSYDITDMQNPVMVSKCADVERCYSLCCEYPYIYTVDWKEGLSIIDASNPENLVLIGNYPEMNYANKILISQDKAYIADGTNGLWIVDVSVPQTPFLISHNKKIGNETPDVISGMCINGDNLYLACSKQGILVTDTAASTSLNVVPTSGEALDIIVENDGSYGYVANGEAGFCIVQFL